MVKIRFNRKKFRKKRKLPNMRKLQRQDIENKWQYI